MRALVLAGGKATRLRPLSNRMPKQLVPVANRPVLERVLADVAELGIAEVGMVVGEWGNRIRAVIGDGGRFGLQVSYLCQDRPRGLAHGVRLARQFLGDQDFVMYLGDTLLPDGIGELADRFRVTRPAAQVTTYRVPDPRAFGVVELDGGGQVRRLVEKPQHPRSDLAVIGVYFFTAAVHRAVAAIRPSDRGELEITDAIQWLLDRGAVVTATEFDGYWKDTGTVGDLLAGNRHLLDRLPASLAGEVDPASLVGPGVTIEPGARVLGSRIVGPSIIGAGALVVGSQVGPHASVGAGCVVRASELRDCIVVSGVPEVVGRQVIGAIVGPGC
jgi:glucose-1-phosphate thymidylyltransferase